MPTSNSGGSRWRARSSTNYYTDFADSKGMINMRGPETAQFGLTLSLLARYYNYTGDRALLTKHRAKVEATAARADGACTTKA